MPPAARVSLLPRGLRGQGCAIKTQDPASASQFLYRGEREGAQPPHHRLISRTAASPAGAGTRTPLCTGSPVPSLASASRGTAGTVPAPQLPQQAPGCTGRRVPPSTPVLEPLGCPIRKVTAGRFGVKGSWGSPVGAQLLALVVAGLGLSWASPCRCQGPSWLSPAPGMVSAGAGDQGAGVVPISGQQCHVGHGAGLAALRAFPRGSPVPWARGAGGTVSPRARAPAPERVARPARSLLQGWPVPGWGGPARPGAAAPPPLPCNRSCLGLFPRAPRAAGSEAPAPVLVYLSEV